MNNKNTKVIVGLSGGVDSSVTALLLKKQGYTVEAVFMKNWEEDDTDSYCAAAKDLKDAEAICEVLDIPLHPINFASEYWDFVFENFLSEYRAGRTPNPDILCNKEIKFKAFLKFAKSLNADFIATGHYARRREIDKRVQMLTAIDDQKDQTYFLYTLNQEQLGASLFPIGDYCKSDVRKIAQKAGIPVFNKKDSTGICFIGERRFKDFLSTYLPHQPGFIVTETGKVIGQHDGLMYYTIGQRSGLGIGGKKDAEQNPWYVAYKDLHRNELIVVQGLDHPLLYQASLIAESCYFTSSLEEPFEGQRLLAKVRYRQVATPCTITKIERAPTHSASQQDISSLLLQNNDNGIIKMSVTFDMPVRAITPGQSLVLYDGIICMGGGIIV